MTALAGADEVAARAGADVAPDLLAEIDDAVAGGVNPALAPGFVYGRRLAADRASRRAAGAYYTPDHLVDFVVERTLGPTVAGRPPAAVLELRVIDPACGAGVFLCAALRALAKYAAAKVESARRAEFLRRAARECLRGVDLDRTAVELCKLSLALTLRSLGAGGGSLGLPAIRHANALLDCPWSGGQVDVVIGNPPWGQKGFCWSRSEREVIRARFKTGSGVIDPCALFVEKAIELVRPGGRWGFVLPDIVLLKNQQDLRDLILATCDLEWIVDSGRAFPSVNLDTVVMVGQRRLCDAGAKCRDQARWVSVWYEIPPNWRERSPAVRRIDQRIFAELPGHRFNIRASERELALWRRLESLPKLGDRFAPHEGVHSGNVRGKLFRRHRPPGPAARLVVGRSEVARYRIDWQGTWLDLDPAAVDRGRGEYASLGQREWHLRRKVVVRRTGDRIVAAFDREGLYFSNNLFVLIPAEEMDDREQRAYVALLNSAFATWYYRTVVPRTGRLFAEIKIQHLRELPVPEMAVWREVAEELADLSEALAAASERGQDPSGSALARLDELVMDLYGLSGPERELIPGG